MLMSVGAAGESQHNVAPLPDASRRGSGYPQHVKSPFAPIVLPIAALIAALARWQVQGSRNLYTALDKRFYIADPDLGWRISTRHPIWLGLEVCVVIAAIAVGLWASGWIIRRREAKHGHRATVLRAASWFVAGVPLVVPIAAFASGAGPADGLDTLPASTIKGIEAGITGILDAPAGRYEVIQHAGTSITAHLSAGQETFDARFDGGMSGGPVVHGGRACGLVSSSLPAQTDDEDHASFVPLLWPAMAIELDDPRSAAPESPTITLLQLAREGIVMVRGYELVELTRDQHGAVVGVRLHAARPADG